MAKHIPRFVLGIAKRKRGSCDSGATADHDPRSLLVSEAFRLCIATVEFWKLRGGAEGAICSATLEQLAGYENNFLEQLRTKARPSLAELVGLWMDVSAPVRLSLGHSISRLRC